MKSRQSRKLLALTAMMCGVSSAFTSGAEDVNYIKNLINKTSVNNMPKMLPDENYYAKDKKQKENDHILQYLSYMKLNNNCINHSFGKRSVYNKRRLPALPDEDYYKSSKASLNNIPKILTSNKLDLDYLCDNFVSSASLKDSRYFCGWYKKEKKGFYNEKYNEFRSAFFQLIQIFETKDPSQICNDEVVSLMKTMRNAVDAVGLYMPITLRYGSEIFVPLNLYDFKKKKDKVANYRFNLYDFKKKKDEVANYRFRLEESTLKYGCFLYAKFIIPKDWDKKFSDIRISSIDEINYRSPGYVCATFTLISNGLKEYKDLRGELKGDIMMGHYTWFDLPKDQKTRYNLPCYSKIK